MSFSKNLTITVRNTVAQLDEPLYVYEKDRNLIMYFKIMDYKYKFDKNPTNVLASVDDIMEAYATIVDPNGYELTRQYGEVIEDEIKFVITDDLIDELDEIGTYRIQFHIKCQHSEFTIPEISFEVLERLKGFRTVTDEGEVGDEILNNSESFIDAEGKLHLVWREGDTISSVRLNQMVEVVNNAVDEEHQRQINEVNRENRANAKLNELETRFSALTTSQQQSAEVIDARDGEASLKARLDRDVKKPLEYYGNVEGSYISTDSTAGYLKDVEILGNTIQNEDNLEDIRSVGNKIEGQELYEIPILFCGKNLFDGKLKFGEISDSTGQEISSTVNTISCEYTKVPNGSSIGVKGFDTTSSYAMVLEYDSSYNFIQKLAISATGINNIKTLNPKTNYIKFKYQGNQSNLKISVFLNENVATPYEPYQEDKLTILSPVQLEKVGDVADRIIEKDGVWGVEKHLLDVTFTGNEEWRGETESIKDVIRFRLKNNPYDFSNINKELVICDKFTFLSSSASSNYDVEGISVAKYNNYGILVSIRKDKLTSNDSDGFNAWLKNNGGLKVIASNNTPQFIPLPHDQQVKLRTFANKTNISFLTEIEGTIKAQVPKSLGATVNTHTTQINNLNKELDRVKKLEESTVSTVTTESDFITVEATSNGYFEDVKLEGKTLVNLAKTFNDNAVSGWIQLNNLVYDVTDKNITVCNLSDKNIKFQTSKLDNSYDNQIIIKPFSSVAVALNNIKFRMIQGAYSDGWTSSDLEIFKKSILVLEGDHTQNPPSYFEGLKSVGQDADEVSVESVNANGNLFDGKIQTAYINNNTFASANSSKSIVFRCEQNTDYIFSAKEEFDRSIVGGSNSEIAIGTPLSQINATKKGNSIYFNSGQFNYIAIYFNTIDSIFTEVRVIKGTTPKPYTPHQSDKKRLLYYNNETQAWEKPILREWDSIEKHADGKYYYHQRSAEVVLNGSEDWSDFSTINGVGKAYTFAIKNKAYGFDNLVCDKLPVTSTFASDATILNGISGTNSNNAIWVSINASITDAQGFKQWLQTNNVTVVYQLAQEKVYECTNIDLITYANETNYIVESGALVPKTTLKVHSNIANVISALQKKVSVLESNYVTLFNTITAAFNSLE